MRARAACRTQVAVTPTQEYSAGNSGARAINTYGKKDYVSREEPGPSEVEWEGIAKSRDMKAPCHSAKKIQLLPVLGVNISALQGNQQSRTSVPLA
jgi:hypothetical protein